MSLQDIGAALRPGGALHAMTAYRQFCVYEIRPKADSPGKTDKQPVIPRSWQDTEALLTADMALSLAASWSGQYPVGVGFVFADTDPFFFLDGDGCYSPKTGWSPVAIELISGLPGAAFEVSSSCTGFHLFGTGSPPEHGCRNGAHRLELYTRGRFAALTGLQAQGSAATDLSAQMAGVVAKYFPASSGGREAVNWEDKAVDGYGGPADDGELIAKMMQSGQGNIAAKAFGGAASLSFREVWEGDADALGAAFPPTNSNDAFDRSAADMSLAQRLAFWTGKNPVRMERLMRLSALVRDKWDDHATYLTNTIEKACAREGDVYTGRGPDNSATIAAMPAADRAALWTTKSRDPFPTGKSPAEVVQQFCMNPESAFSKAWHSGDMAKVASQLAWKLGSNCEAVLEALKIRGLEDSEEVRTLVLAACTSTTKWASGDSSTVEGLPPGVKVIASDDPFYGAERQIEIFDGCAYVARHNKIVTPAGELYEQAVFNAVMPAGVYTMCPKESVTKKPWDVFVGSMLVRFQRVDDVAFRPDLTPGHVYNEEGVSFFNRYVPFTPPRLAGDAAPFLRHVALMLPDPRDQQILLTWMGAVVQNPGRKFRWAPVMQGWEGNGKGLLQDTMQRAVGRKYTHLAQAADIGNKFNAWISGKLLICVSEVNASHDMDVIDALKPMVSDDFVAVQGKGADQATARNFANFMFSTNRPAAMGKAVEGRRYAVFYTAQQTAEDVARDMPNSYFVEFHRWLDNGGHEIAIDFLATMPLIDEFNPAGSAIVAPRTSSFEASKAAALGTVEQALMDAVAEGREGFKGGFIGSHGIKAVLQEMRKENRVAPNRRREVLQSIGYDWHPALVEGRATRPSKVNGTKEVIFVKMDHPAAQLQTAAQVMGKYEEAQLIAAEDSIFSLKR